MPRGDPLALPPGKSANCCRYECLPRFFPEQWGLAYFEVLELEADGAPQAALYVVVRHVRSHDKRKYRGNQMEAGPADAFVRGFGTREAALACRKRQERAAYAALRPGMVECAVPADFAARVGELGLAPPKDGGVERESEELQDWLLGWWESLGSAPTREQRVAVWKLLKAKFFGVLKVSLKD